MTIQYTSYVWKRKININILWKKYEKILLTLSVLGDLLLKIQPQAFIMFGPDRLEIY